MTSTAWVSPLKLSSCPYDQSKSASGARACHRSGASSGATSEESSATAQSVVRSGRGSQTASSTTSAPAATPSDTPGLNHDSHAADFSNTAAAITLSTSASAISATTA